MYGFYRNHCDNFGFEKKFLQSLKEKSMTTRMKKHLHEYIKIIIILAIGNIMSTLLDLKSTYNMIESLLLYVIRCNHFDIKNDTLNILYD
mgnify:CR=1 FL=1